MSLTAKKFIERKEREFERDKELQKEIMIRDNEGGTCCFIRDKWILIEKSDGHGQVFCLERLKVCRKIGRTCTKKLKEGDYVYRPGYFIIGKKGKPDVRVTSMSDNLVWEGHAPLVPQKDFKKILKSAVSSGIIRPEFLIISPF